MFFVVARKHVVRSWRDAGAVVTDVDGATTFFDLDDDDRRVLRLEDRRRHADATVGLSHDIRSCYSCS